MRPFRHSAREREAASKLCFCTRPTIALVALQPTSAQYFPHASQNDRWPLHREASGDATGATEALEPYIRAGTKLLPTEMKGSGRYAKGNVQIQSRTYATPQREKVAKFKGQKGSDVSVAIPHQ